MYNVLQACICFVCIHVMYKLCERILKFEVNDEVLHVLTLYCLFVGRHNNIIYNNILLSSNIIDNKIVIGEMKR